MNRKRLVCNTGPLIEQRGRRVARRIYGLDVIGTARVLVDLKKAGKLECVGPSLEFLVGKGYWLSQSVLDWALKAAGEHGG